MDPTAPGSHPDTWFGFRRARTHVAGRHVDVVQGTARAWPPDHRRRLENTRYVAGLVPIIDVIDPGDGTILALQTVPPGPTLADTGAGNDWRIETERFVTIASAVHRGHLLGLHHGALSACDIHMIPRSDGSFEVAVGGMGLGFGGEPEADQIGLMAPEVVTGQPPDPRADVYCLGRVLEHQLLGAAGAPTAVRQLIASATSWRATDRPASAFEMAATLKAALGPGAHRPPLAALEPGQGGVIPVEPGPPERSADPAETASPRRDLQLLVIVLLIVGALGLGAWLTQWAALGPGASTSVATSAEAAADGGPIRSDPTSSTTTGSSTDPDVVGRTDDAPSRAAIYVAATLVSAALVLASIVVQRKF